MLLLIGRGGKGGRLRYARLRLFSRGLMLRSFSAAATGLRERERERDLWAVTRIFSHQPGGDPGRGRREIALKQPEIFLS